MSKLAIEDGLIDDSFESSLRNIKRDVTKPVFGMSMLLPMLLVLIFHSVDFLTQRHLIKIAVVLLFHSFVGRSQSDQCQAEGWASSLLGSRSFFFSPRTAEDFWESAQFVSSGHILN